MKNLLHYSFLAVLYLLIAGPHLSIIEKGKAVGILHSGIMRNDPKTGITENDPFAHSNLPYFQTVQLTTPDPSTEAATGSSNPENLSNLKPDCPSSNTMLGASKCDSIAFAVEPFNLLPGACCWRLVVENEVDSCFNQIQLTLHNNVFTDVVVDVPNGWTAVGLGNQLLLTHTSGYIPTGTNYPLYWCLPAATTLDSLTVESQYVCSGLAGSCDTTLALGCAQGYTCCEDYDAFLQNLQNAINVSTVDSACKAVVTVAGLPPCDSLLYIDWGDGNIDFGAFSNGMYMHTYSQSGNYTILIPVIELSALGPCFDAGLDFPVSIDCGGNPCDTATIVLNTGWDNQDSTVITAPGVDVDLAPDLDWSVTADPLSFGPTPRPADVIAPAHPLWDPPFPNSQWISACPLGCNDSLPGTPQQFTYEVCFNLPPGFSNAQLSIQARADEVIDTVLLGSNYLYIVPPYPPYPPAGGFSGPPLIITDSIQPHFTPGINCLTVKYSDVTGLVTGLNVAGGVTYCPFPCDSLWVTKDSLNTDSCCYSLDFGVHATPIQFIEVESLTPGAGFNNASIDTTSGLLLDGGPAGTLLTIHTTPHASIPAGDYPGLLHFCLSNVTSTSQVPQRVVVRWYSGPNAMDAADLVCTDTLYFYCPITCCEDHDAFFQNVQNAIAVTAVDSLCKAVIDISDLSPCDSIISINWGDGNMDTGPFGDGMYMHTYAQSGTYTISIIAYEFDENGDICFEDIFYFPVAVNCDCHCGDWNLSFNFAGLSNPVDCGDSLYLECPAVMGAVITGSFNCLEDSCAAAPIDWQLHGPNGSTTGITSPNGIFITLPAPFDAGWYSLTLSTICGSDTCDCEITWYQEDCPVDSCCLDPAIFEQNIQNAISVSVADSLCKAVLTVAGLPSCDSIIYIDWGDGNMDTGPFGNGMYMHTYAQSGTYTISVLALEFDASGVICFEDIFFFPVTVNCDCQCGDWKFVFNFGSPGLFFPAECGDTLLFECPPDSNVVLHGDFTCMEDPCLPAPIEWVLEGPNTTTTGIASPDSIQIAFSSPFDAGWYHLSLNALCGSDTCFCEITWYQEECPVDTCCLDPAIFDQNISNAISVTAVDSLCKAVLTVAGLPPCDSIISIDWGDGNTDTGPFGNGMYMHAYAQGGTYAISVIAFEYDTNGDVCFENIFYFPLTVNCECQCGDWALAFNYTGIGTPVDCGDTLHFECPAIIDAVITGSFSCLEDSCLATPIEWEIHGPNASYTGITSPDNISIALPTPFDGGWYQLTLSTLCGSDTCVCEITWYQEDCPVDSCCLAYDIFTQNVQNAVSLSTVDSLCKAILTVSGLPPCDSIISIDWGDGNTDTGPFSNGMYMHTYAQSGTYNINMVAVEYDSSGNACFDLDMSFTVDVDCTGTATGESEELPVPEIFPNPVSGQLFISLPVPGEWTVEIWSFDGRQVLPPETLVASPDPWPLDAGSLPPGVYLVVVKNGGPNGSVWRGRVVKM